MPVPPRCGLQLQLRRTVLERTAAANGYKGGD